MCVERSHRHVSFYVMCKIYFFFLLEIDGLDSFPALESLCLQTPEQYRN